VDFNFDPPVQENTPLFSAWVARQFDRIKDVFSDTQVERKGVIPVNGSLVIATGLQRVQYCIAQFNGDPSVAAMAIACRPDATAGSILVRVFAWGNTWAPTLVLSTTPVNVAWFAYGF
jgi:hypothetical protein